MLSPFSFKLKAPCAGGGHFVPCIPLCKVLPLVGTRIYLRIGEWASGYQVSWSQPLVLCCGPAM